jgi:hypothetical protein
MVYRHHPFWKMERGIAEYSAFEALGKNSVINRARRL